jgi:SPP1 family predicted phage head-tail adaptor
MRHRITIERATKTPDGAGGSTQTWIPIATVWADVKPVSGNERYQSMRVEADVSHTILTRYRSDILPSDRAIFDGRQMQIKSVINIEERNRYLEIKAVEGEAV